MVPQAEGQKPQKDLIKTNPQPNGHGRTTSKADNGPPPVPRKNASGEYGRLFIKVVKIKELELPIPKGINFETQC